MNKKNYNDECFIETSEKLFFELNRISEQLITNMQTPDKSFIVEDIISNKKRFNSFWDLEINWNNNKYSKNEFKGLYAFANVKNGVVDFQYIGISQTIRRRFNAHVRRTTRPEASWAYLMIKKDFPNLSKEERELKIPEYQKKIIYPQNFTFVLIDDNMLMHIAEVFCVNNLKSYWNSFETH